MSLWHEIRPLTQDVVPFDPPADVGDAPPHQTKASLGNFSTRNWLSGLTPRTVGSTCRPFHYRTQRILKEARREFKMVRSCRTWWNLDLNELCAGSWRENETWHRFPQERHDLSSVICCDRSVYVSEGSKDPGRIAVMSCEIFLVDGQDFFTGVYSGADR